MIRLKARQQEKEQAEKQAAAEPTANDGSSSSSVTESGKSSRDEDSLEREASSEKKVRIFGIGRGKKGDRKQIGKKRTPGEIRIQNDVAELDGGNVAKISFPSPNDLTNFVCKIKADTGFWKGAEYVFTFKIPALYPHEAPKVKCETKIYHPNIDMEGNVCLNILREDWKPVLDINSVIYGLIYLFYEPNPDDPLNKEAAELFRNDIKQFERVVARTLRGGYVCGHQFDRLV